MGAVGFGLIGRPWWRRVEGRREWAAVTRRMGRQKTKPYSGDDSPERSQWDGGRTQAVSTVLYFTKHDTCAVKKGWL